MDDFGAREVVPRLTRRARASDTPRLQRSSPEAARRPREGSGIGQRAERGLGRDPGGRGVGNRETGCGSDPNGIQTGVNRDPIGIQSGSIVARFRLAHD